MRLSARLAALLALPVLPALLAVLMGGCVPLTPAQSRATLMHGPWHYPAAARDAVVDDYFGTRVADPYRWLEQLDAPATRRWVQAENRLSQPWLAALPQREWVRQRLTALLNYTHFGVPVQEGGHYFFTRNSGLQDQSVLYVADALGGHGDEGSQGGEDIGSARVLLDPNTLSRDGTVALADFVPDPQGRRIAYALSDAGSDWKSWHVRDVDSGQDLPDVLRDAKFTSVSWARDGSGFYYSRYPARPDGSGDDQRQALIYFHRLGTSQARDRQIYAVSDDASRVPYGTVTDDGRYLVVTVEAGTLTNGIVVLPLAAAGARTADGPDGAPAAPVRLLYRFDALYDFIGSDGDELYFATTADAPRTRIIAVNVQRPDPSAWRTVVPEAADVLSQASLVGGHLFAVYLHAAHSVVQVFDRDGGAGRQIALPGLGSVFGFQGHDYDRQTWFGYTDYFTPMRIFGYTIASGATRALWTPTLAADVEPYVTEQVFYTSHDGTRVPMFLVHRRDLVRDGHQPVLLYGYGGFDIALTPGYSATALTWLQMGGVYAVANLRGGSEYGEAWHLAGSRLHKQNTFDDFIAAAEYLIRERYTQPARLAISGASNGGLLIGAVMTQRPELFGAALPAVGVLDMLRYQTASANARQWASDYGTSDNAADFKALYAYSPYQHVRKGVCYPPTLVTTADHDNRVVPWNSYKFAAALQWAQGCSHPVLVRIETRAGHGAGKPLWMQIEDYADQWAFAAEALGITLPAPVAVAAPKSVPAPKQ